MNGAGESRYPWSQNLGVSEQCRSGTSRQHGSREVENGDTNKALWQS
jgi:hypothetical protein